MCAKRGGKKAYALLIHPGSDRPGVFLHSVNLSVKCTQLYLELG